MLFNAVCLFSHMMAAMSPEMVLEEPKAIMAFEEGKEYFVRIQTTKGEIVGQLFPEQAPYSVTNFIYLVQNGFYTDLLFYRVVADTLVQVGDPKANGTGGPGYSIPKELGLSHEKGVMAWLNVQDRLSDEERSSGSQFYITLQKLPRLDKDHAVFGQIISGMDVVEQIAIGDKIEKIEVFN